MAIFGEAFWDLILFLWSGVCVLGALESGNAFNHYIFCAANYLIFYP